MTFVVLFNHLLAAAFVKTREIFKLTNGVLTYVFYVIGQDVKISKACVNHRHISGLAKHPVKKTH